MRLLTVLVLVIAFAAPAASLQDQKDSPAAAPEMKSLPPLNLQDFNGKAVPSDQFKGSVLVIDFWATWCGPCIAEIPSLNRLQQQYGEKGVKVIGVTLQSGDAKEVKPFVGRNKMKYTVLMGDDDQIYDLNVFAFPTTYLITRDWKVYRRYFGAGPRKAAQLESDIQKLLASN